VVRAETFLAALHPRQCPEGLRPAFLDVMYLPADEFLLSASRRLDGFAITVTWADRDGRLWERLSRWMRRLSSVCMRLGGRVHLVKNVEADTGDLRKMYGDAFDRFLALKRRYDPDGVLRNAFFDRIFGAG
jgi:FAD/FMN-containing dehydrogenase